MQKMHLMYFDYLLKPIYDRKEGQEENSLSLTKKHLPKTWDNIILNRKKLAEFFRIKIKNKSVYDHIQDFIEILAKQIK